MVPTAAWVKAMCTRASPAAAFTEWLDGEGQVSLPLLEVILDAYRSATTLVPIDRVLAYLGPSVPLPFLDLSYTNVCFTEVRGCMG